MDAIVVELATSLNRFRSLTDDESNWLEQALRREGRRNGQKAWVRGGWLADDPKLKRMLKAGKRPAQIALKLNRTPRAVYRRMYKLGLSCGQGSVAVVAVGER